MARLTNATTSTATLAAGATSQTFHPVDGPFTLTVGGSFETSTATLEVCGTREGTFTTLVCDNTSGTPTDQAFSVTHVSASTKSYARKYDLPGLFFRVTTNSTGTPPAITVDVNSADGSHITIRPISGSGA